MTTFTASNPDIIEKLRTVKGLTIAERLRDYQTRLQQLVRSRLAEAMKERESCWQRKELYREAIVLLFEFEFEFLLLSIYFDEDEDYQLEHLSSVLSAHKPVKFDDRYLLLRLLERREVPKGRVQYFLDRLFVERAGLRALRPKPKTNEFLEINHVITWVLNQMQLEAGLPNVSLALLHFAKFWHLKYATPFNYTAAILFLHKLEEGLTKMSFENTKVDFGAALKIVGADFANLSKLPASPVLNLTDPESLRGMNHLGYMKRIESIKRWVTINALKFRDWKQFSVSELFSEHCNARSEIKPAFVKEIMSRFGRTEVLSGVEIERIRSVNNGGLSPDSNHLYEEILRINYLFF